MAGTTVIRNLVLGEGIPKICVPVMGSNLESVLASARAAVECQPDIVEWRADYLADVKSRESILEILTGLRELLSDTPLLFTFRTKQEGGEQELALEDYVKLCYWALESRRIDALDVELFLPAQEVQALIARAHNCGVKVIVSNHDFAKTPAREEMAKRLCRMQEIGADIAKIAVMPADAADVLALLEVTQECRGTLHVPLITMSMGAAGVVSRLLGETFGSALTFGMVGQASAPGQIPAGELRELLQKLHNYTT